MLADTATIEDRPRTASEPPDGVGQLVDSLEWLVDGYAAAELLALRRPLVGTRSGGGGDAEAGELPFVTHGARPLVVAFVRRHARRRLRLIRRLLELEQVGGRWRPSPASVISRVDEALAAWRLRPFAAAVDRWFPPLLTAAGGAVAAPLAAIAADASRSILIGALSASIVVSFLVAGSFAGKRACFLAVHPNVPGGDQSTSIYALETRVLGFFGVRRREFPLDLALVGFWNGEAAVLVMSALSGLVGVVVAAPGLTIALVCAAALGRRIRRDDAW